MDIQNVQKNYKEDLKSKVISIRTTKGVSEWMKENKISPTKVFNEAIKELRKNETKTK